MTVRRVAVPPVTGAPRPPSGPPMVLQGATMGTAWSVKLYPEGRASEAALQAGAQARLDKVVAQMSHWEADSDLSLFSRAPAGAWVDLPAPFFKVLGQALAIAEASGGAFDPAIGALVEAWGFGAGGPRQAPPTEAGIKAAQEAGGWRRLRLDAGSRRALQPGGLALDLSGIAKGFGVDSVAEFLLDAGVGAFLVEVGGELRGEGVKADGAPWWVELERPGPGAAPLVAALYGLSVATSGDYRRYFEHDGRRYPHTLDPRTGRPIDNDIASVSVLHPSCMIADAMATAIGVLGWEAGARFAQAQGLAAQILRRGPGGLAEHLSPVLAGWVG